MHPTYLVLLQYLGESNTLSTDEAAQGIDVITAFVDLLSILGKAPLPLGRDATVVGALQNKSVYLIRDVAWKEEEEKKKCYLI